MHLQIGRRANSSLFDGVYIFLLKWISVLFLSASAWSTAMRCAYLFSPAATHQELLLPYIQISFPGYCSKITALVRWTFGIMPFKMTVCAQSLNTRRFFFDVRCLLCGGMRQGKKEELECVKHKIITIIFMEYLSVCLFVWALIKFDYFYRNRAMCN